MLHNTELFRKRVFFYSFFKGHSLFPRRQIVLLVTDGQSNINEHLTVLRANELRDVKVEVFVLAVGDYNSISGIHEMVQVANHPPEENLFRVDDMKVFWNIIKLAVKEVYPDKWHIVNYDPPC